MFSKDVCSYYKQQGGYRIPLDSEISSDNQWLYLQIIFEYT